MTVGENIRKYRKERGLKQTELGEIIGKDMSTVSQWERGRRNPKVDVLEKIADALNVSIHDLLGEKEEPPVTVTIDAKRYDELLVCERKLYVIGSLFKGVKE